ncbi:MAG TPA: hypothetical protein VFP98_07700 [Candidatus Polarisedimenticolia bacterium]|nr:hypothetical protein [Candidatus Polarisedimenticolia bacterium]
MVTHGSCSIKAHVSGRTALVVLVAALSAGFAPDGPAAAEARARGRKADIVYVDEKGKQQTVLGRDIRYGYYTRALLSVPKDGKGYRDDERQLKSIPLAQEDVKFSATDTIHFAWEPGGESGAVRLRVTIRLAKGREVSGPGASLLGAGHPTSPYIAFTVDGKERRIDLHPIGPDEQRQGKPRIVSMTFIP